MNEGVCSKDFSLDGQTHYQYPSFVVLGPPQHSPTPDRFLSRLIVHEQTFRHSRAANVGALGWSMQGSTIPVEGS